MIYFLFHNNFVQVYSVPGVALPVSTAVTLKSKINPKGMLSTTHTSTDPSFSTATYVSEENERVPTVRLQVLLDIKSKSYTQVKQKLVNNQN